MRITIVLVFSLVLYKAKGQCNLMLTGVFDGPLPGGLPKVVELYVNTDISDLNNYGLGSANNGGGSDGIEFLFPNDTVQAGSFIYISAESTAFFDFFGFAPNYLTGTLPTSACYFNGNDAIELFYQNQIIDRIGDSNVDGSGTVWDYQDGWLYRYDNQTCNLGSYDYTMWESSGTGVLLGASDNDSATYPFPIGTYQNSPLPIHDFVVEYEVYEDLVLLNILLLGTLENETILLERSTNGLDFTAFQMISPHQLILKLELSGLRAYEYLKIKLLDNAGRVFVERVLFLNWKEEVPYVCYYTGDDLVLINTSEKVVSVGVYFINSQSFKSIELHPFQEAKLSISLRIQPLVVLFKDKKGRSLFSKRILL